MTSQLTSHWNCCVAGCFNSHRRAKEDPSLGFFRIPKRHRAEYNAFLKTDNINWDTARICSQHWSKPKLLLRRGKGGYDVLPDIRVPDEPRTPQAARAKSTPYERAAVRNKGKLLFPFE